MKKMDKEDSNIIPINPQIGSKKGFEKDKNETRHTRGNGDVVYGDKVEVVNSGENCVHNYAGMLPTNDTRDLREILKEKDEVIKLLKEVIKEKDELLSKFNK